MEGLQRRAESKRYNNRMRWLLTILVLLMVVLTSIPWLSKFGLGKLPGDINFSIGKHHISIPLASTILIFVVCYFIGRLI